MFFLFRARFGLGRSAGQPDCSSPMIAQSNNNYFIDYNNPIY
jgi:hypothetical protein